MPTPPPATPPPRIRVHDLRPAARCGRHPVKRTSGDVVVVECDLVRDGHESLRAVVRHRPPGAAEHREEPLRQVTADRWRGEFATGPLGPHPFAVEAWVDRFASWSEELRRKRAAGQADLAGELAEGALLLESAAERLRGAARDTVLAALAEVRGGPDGAARAAAALDPAVADAMAGDPGRPDRTRSEELTVDVDRERARAGAWYELFPRSFGGFRGVERALPRLAELGVDVVYLPPIHPIGVTNRRGRGNAPVAAPGDPGSPWAIGGPAGGHTAVDPGLGTLADFDRMVAAASRAGVEIALDFAIQCSPDHPWLREHPEWFQHRPDGSLKYAENPPKRYEDIHNLDFDSPDWRGLWEALREALLFWVRRGVRIFRVDNPHTKPIPFWEWLIRTVREEHPDVVFLAEAFTTPARMYALAGSGFSQSYTYFTWKNTRAELTEYLTELAGPVSEYMRPNMFVNTPDILHAYLQEGGRPAFEARLVLAATLSPSYGVYSGFEDVEREPAAPGSEEYRDSEKYAVRDRRLDGPLLPLMGRLNEIRRRTPALLRLGQRFLATANEELIAYAKGMGPGTVIVVADLDPHRAHEGLVDVPGDLGLPGRFRVRDLLSGAVYDWGVGGNYVRLDPAVFPAHVLRAEP